MRAVASSVVAILLSACALQPEHSLRPGVSTLEDVYRALGRPASDVAGPDGARYLAYPTGPMGLTTLMARVGRDGKVESVRQVLDEDQIQRVHPGLSRDDVLRLIGPPGEQEDFARLGQTAWDYRYRDTWGYITILSVMFDGRWIVVGKVKRRIEPDRGRD